MASPGRRTGPPVEWGALCFPFLPANKHTLLLQALSMRLWVVAKTLRDLLQGVKEVPQGTEANGASGEG